MTVASYDSVERWRSQLPASAAARLDGWLQVAQQRCSDDRFAQLFERFFEHFDVPTSAFLHQTLNTEAGAALAGIRFFGGDPKRPFVALLAWNGPADPTPLVDELLAHWAPFAPKHVQVLLPAASAPDHAELDLGIFSAPCRDVAVSGPIAPDLELMPIEQGEEAEALAMVGRVYERAFAERPELIGTIRPLQADALADCCENGTADWMLFAGERMGLLATQPDEIEWFTGEVVYERAVSPEHWGSGLSTQALRRLAERLAAADPEAQLLGTILAANQASRRSAAQAGRAMDYAYYFLGGKEDRAPET